MIFLWLRFLHIKWRTIISVCDISSLLSCTDHLSTRQCSFSERPFLKKVHTHWQTGYLGIPQFPSRSHWLIHAYEIQYADGIILPVRAFLPRMTRHVCIYQEHFSHWISQEISVVSKFWIMYVYIYIYIYINRWYSWNSAGQFLW